MQHFDIVSGNLETPISEAPGASKRKQFVFDMRSQTPESLKYAGFDILSVVNNHTLDYGSKYFLETLNHLTSNDFQYVGAGMNLKDAEQICVVKKKGIKVGFLAFYDLSSNTTLTEPSWANHCQ